MVELPENRDSLLIRVRDPQGHAVPQEIAKCEDNLRVTSNRAFETRQMAQSAEIHVQRNKLDKLQQQVQQRAAQANSIIDRRFKQLQQQAKE